jgi:polyisoprenyl-teichoic acid--peptidoglycan teichoic acid transferase
MTRSQKTIIAFLSLVALSLIVAIGVNVSRAYNQPLGPQLPGAAQTLPPTWTASPGPSPTSAGLVTLAPTVSFATNTPAAKCGGPNVMNILVIGADTRGDNYTYGLADAIRILRVDFVTPKVTVLEFPRDLWVEIPHIADNLDGQDHEKLNQAYLYGQPGFNYWDEPSGGSGLLALTLNINFGVRIDHYVTVNMRTFVNIVNAVGGIEVNIPDKQTARNTDLSVGYHHLDGDETLKVVRNRYGGTFERADNQNLVLCALRDKLTSPKVVTQIPQLIESFQDNVRTDFTPEQLGQLACLGAQMPPQNIAFAGFPQELFKQTRVYDPVFDKRIYILDTDFNILRDYVTQFQNGTWPSASVTSNPSTDEEETSAVVCE